MRRGGNSMRWTVRDTQANIFSQRLTVRSTIWSRVGKCSRCPGDGTRCRWWALPELSRSNLVRFTIHLPKSSQLIIDAADPRMGGGPPRHHSVSDFGDGRSFSGSNLQNFYATQRHQPSRGANEAEQVMQAKRRMAAQRERELRNYHQEQQYNRSRPHSSNA